LAHDTIGYLATHGGPSTLAELAAFNLAAPRVRMPRGQFFVALANLFDLSAADYEVAAGTHAAATQTRLRRTFDASGATVLVSLSNLHSEVYAGAGYPAVSVPLGLRRNGMPVGATLIGRPGRDAELLAHAAAFERATRLRQPPASAG
jgi:amidase